MDILSRPVLRAEHRIPYGPDPSQFGDLWLPDATPGTGHPVVAFFHGGWWKSEYDLGYAGYLCDSLRHHGIATWSIEYRRTGATGGGWPNTFLDAAAGFDHLATLAKSFPLDLSRVLVMGHSAGGHLAFWTAGRQHIEARSEVFLPNPLVSPRGVISLAGAVDLETVIELSGHDLFAHDRDEVYRLMGGTPAALSERYRAGDPGHLLPFQAPQLLLQGTADDQIPPDLPHRWVSKSKASGSQASAVLLPGADHLDVVDPTSKAWPTILQNIQSLLQV